MIEATPKLTNILYALANSRLPWGVEWDSFLPLCGGLDEPEEYILCCGHTLTRPEACEAIGAGLLLPGPEDKFGRQTLVITKQGRGFLAGHMDLVQFDG